MPPRRRRIGAPHLLPFERPGPRHIFAAILATETAGCRRCRPLDRGAFWRCLDEAPGALVRARPARHGHALTFLPLDDRRLPAAVVRARRRDAAGAAVPSSTRDPRYVVRQLLTDAEDARVLRVFRRPTSCARASRRAVPARCRRERAGRTSTAARCARTLRRGRRGGRGQRPGRRDGGAAPAPRAACDVLVLEEGHEAARPSFVASGVRALAALYRDMGTSMAFGNSPMPVPPGLRRGRHVGGERRHQLAVPARGPRRLGRGRPARSATRCRSRPSRPPRPSSRRGSTCTRPSDAIAGPKNLLLARGAEALGARAPADPPQRDGLRRLGPLPAGLPARRQAVDGPHASSPTP